jgi:PAS domain S-box-containing protein
MDLDLLLNTTSDGISVTDVEGNFTFFNAAHCKLFGYDESAELIGRSWRILYPRDEIERLEAEAFSSLQQTGHWHGLVQAKRRDGSLFHERLTLSELSEGGVLCICNELTEQQLLQSKLGQSFYQRSEEMERRGRLFALANHEMRAPLSSISLAAELLGISANVKNAAKRAKLIGQICDQAFRVGELMDKFLFLGSQFSGVLPFSPVETDLHAFLDNFAKQNFGVVNDAADRVEYTINGENSRRLLDPVLLKHCLGNLLSNAVKFRDVNTPVNLHIDCREPDKVSFSVTNQGPSPDAEIAAQLFEPFFRYDYSGASVVQGSGLGLYLVRECVSSHGGAVAFVPIADGVRVEGYVLAACVEEKMPIAVTANE